MTQRTLHLFDGDEDPPCDDTRGGDPASTPVASSGRPRRRARSASPATTTAPSQQAAPPVKRRDRTTIVRAVPTPPVANATPTLEPDSASSQEGNLPGLAELPILSVTELTALIDGVLRTDFSAVAVRGELSRISRAQSGHLYFRIKDDFAVIDAVIWRSTAARLPFDLTEGLEVEARGGLEVYAPRGSYQLVLTAIEPRGVGALDLAYRQRLARFQAEGLFDPARKRSRPAFPMRIVVVTSPVGAAVRDILQILGRRWPLAEVIVVPTVVQGAEAAPQIAQALLMADRLLRPDVIIVGRGGGSVEDLWAFNEEVVVRAIAACEHMVISAVGHEVDFTLADLVADQRAATPSEAAELCAPLAEKLREALVATRTRLDRALARRLHEASARLALARSGLERAGRALILQTRNRVERLADRLDRAMRADLLRRRATLRALAGRLDALSPLAILARGYSLTLLEDDSATCGPPQRPLVVRDATCLKPGDRLRTRLARGMVLSRVEAVEAGDEPNKEHAVTSCNT